MADKEASIQNQIAAMEGWAIDTKTKADSRSFAFFYKEVEDDLKNLNLQGRRLEWRGGKYGLKHLPDLEEVKELKTKISSARAAAQNALTSIHDLTKLLPKKEGKTPAEIAAIERKEVNLKKDADKNITILIQVLKQARAIADKEPWINPAILSEPKNKESLFMFLRRENYYKKLSEQERLGIIKKIDFKFIDFRNANLMGAYLVEVNLVEVNLRGANLSGANLERANLTGAYLSGANLERANLSGAYLMRAYLMGANLVEAILERANLSEANLSGAYLMRANLRVAYLGRANLSGANLSGANLSDVIKLTADQLRSAKNWDKATGIPSNLL